MEEQSSTIDNSEQGDTLYKGVGDYHDLAAIDLSQSNEQITEGIMKQLQTVGFLLLTNVSGFSEKTLYEECKWFFALPEEEKRRLCKNHFVKENTNFYRGIAPFVDNDVSLKELFDIGLDYEVVSEEEKQYSLHEETPWPIQNDEGKKFKAFMEKYYEVMHKLGMQIMGHIAQGYGKPQDFFNNWFIKDTVSTLRPIHYLPRTTDRVKMDSLSKDDLKLTTPPHTDSGFLTFLTTFSFPGLQVKIDDQYKSVRPVSETIVVNIGDMLSRITNYDLKATYHQVLDIGVERYSCPFFFEPHYAARIPSTILENEQGSDQQEEFVYGDWVIEKMKQWAEYKDFNAVKKRVNQSL